MTLARPKRPRRDREVDEVARAASRMIRAVGARAADHDVDALPYLADLVKVVDEQLQAAVTNLHEQCGYSWGRIGVALGISRQSAHERFARPTAPAPAPLRSGVRDALTRDRVDGEGPR